MKFLIDTDRVCWSKCDDETVLLNLETGFYYTLDELGGLIWDLFSQKFNKNDVKARILEEYDVESATIEEHIADFIKKLQRENLITIIQEN